MISRLTARWSVIAVTAVALTGCTSIYYPTEGWARRNETGPFSSAESEVDKSQFRIDLVDCVSTADPRHLDELKDSGTYRFTGWFVPADRFGPGSVRACMVAKGWQPFPR
jgi:hypothetical protein